MIAFLVVPCRDQFFGLLLNDFIRVLKESRVSVMKLAVKLEN